MRFTVLTAAALLSAAPFVAAIDAQTLIDGYERFLPLGDQMWDYINTIKPSNALLVAPVRACGGAPPPRGLHTPLTDAGNAENGYHAHGDWL